MEVHPQDKSQTMTSGNPVGVYDDDLFLTTERKISAKLARGAMLTLELVLRIVLTGAVTSGAKFSSCGV